MDDEPSALVLAAAERLESLAARTTRGRWELTGLLASRPEVVARFPDGSSEHVAEARARTAAWIEALSPDLAAPLAGWLRATADAAADGPLPAEALAVARALLP